jgi:predicted PurR-regulated permease PerM
VIFIIILQQLESNIIYPRVVGDSVGLPAMWVMVCVVLGGEIFGIWGMLLSVPVCAVLYVLLRAEVYERIGKKRKTNIE